MASSSAVAHKWKYDVFLSFRGKDTRNTFTSHLYDALSRKKIKTFIDDGLERGEEITPSLLKTIEESRVSIVIFSENYASSPWCLDELVKILECKETYGQIVLPLFYHVDPSDVDEQTGSFGNAFAELEKNFKGKMDKVPRWRDDLRKAASISGWDSQVTSPECKLVREVVQAILKRLNRATPSKLRGLVGVDSRIEQINKLLYSVPSDVRTLGIWGMGGIGKTTIAGAFYDRYSSQYEGHHFLPNIRQESEKGRLNDLRDELLSKLLEEENLRVGTPHIPTFTWDRLCQKKVLLVLDDVNDVRQFQHLIEERSFGEGSVVVITSRDKQVLKNVVDEIYEVEELNSHEALQLFSLNAFKGNHPPKAYMELSITAINYAKGNPLALQVLGSFLFDKGRHFWESQLNEIESFPELNIYDLLRIGFDALRDRNTKSIFLDIACFFRGHRVDFVKRILDGCDFKTDIGLSVLIDRCLIKISDDKVEMHDLLQEMAHELVRKESIDELGRQSRLWSPKDIYQVLTNNLGTEKVEGIFLDVSKIREIELSSTALKRMYKLRLLKIYNSEAGVKCRVHLPHGLASLSEELRYLHWDGYPLTSLPCNFHPENLVELNLSYSKVKQLWRGDQNLVNLKDVNLSKCEHITFLPDLSKARNLERLNLQFCTSLVKVPSSIQHLDKLNDLDLRGCKSLINLPSRFNSSFLETLNLSGCANIKKCPETARKLTYLNLNETAVEELPQSIGELSGLVALNLKNCKLLVNLPENMYLLTSLLIADFSGCSSISRLFDFSRNIRYLYLNGTAIEELPSSSIGDLRKLIYLDLAGCNRLRNLPSAVSKLVCLEKLDLSGCSSITEFPKVSNNIKELYLDGTAIREIPSSIECLCELHELHLRNCKQFEILPSSICKLRKLQRLNLSGCLQFRDFPEVLEPMDCLRYLYLEQTRITKLPSPIGNLKGLACLEVGNCKDLTGINCLVVLQLPQSRVDLACLRKLNLNGCHIMKVPDSLGLLSSLEVLDLSGNNFQTIPISINKLFELQYLGLRNCKRLESLPDLPPRLSKLDVDNCRSLHYLVSSSSTVVEGNIFEFIFTNCLGLRGINQILAYSLLKFQRYTIRLYHQLPDVPEGACSFCLPGDMTPEWFSHQSWGSIVTFQLSSHWANTKFLGFSLCAVIVFCSFKHSLQVKCTYHFRNEHGDSHDLYCYLHGWYDKKRIYSEHIFVGLDPCLVATENDMFSKYSEVSVEFQVEDMNGYLLPLDLYQVVECGVRLLHANDEDEIQRFHLIMSDSSRFCPLDLDELEGRFQAKRARLEANRLEDFSVMCRTFEFLVNSLPTFIFYSEELYHEMPAGTFSFSLSGDVTPEWFSHQRWGSTVTFQLSSQWANSKSFLGFCLCAIIAFCSFGHSLQVKCTYHFRNEHGDSHDVYCYLHGWYDEKRIDSEHIFVGFDPCLVVKEKDMFSEYNEISIEFQLEDMNGNLLPLDFCQVNECGVRLLDAEDKDEIHRFALTMPKKKMRYMSTFCPLDRDDLEAMFQAKRARFEGMRWDEIGFVFPSREKRRHN